MEFGVKPVGTLSFTKYYEANLVLKSFNRIPNTGVVSPAKWQTHYLQCAARGTFGKCFLEFSLSSVLSIMRAHVLLFLTLSLSLSLSLSFSPPLPMCGMWLTKTLHAARTRWRYYLIYNFLWICTEKCVGCWIFALPLHRVESRKWTVRE